MMKNEHFNSIGKNYLVIVFITTYLSIG